MKMTIKDLKYLQKDFKNDGVKYTIKELKEMLKNGLLEGFN
jgi:hypothetical protein